MQDPERREKYARKQGDSWVSKYRRSTEGGNVQEGPHHPKLAATTTVHKEVGDAELRSRYGANATLSIREFDSNMFCGVREQHQLPAPY